MSLPKSNGETRKRWHVGPVGCDLPPARVLLLALEHICTTRLACKQAAPLLLQINVVATNICACQVNMQRCSDKYRCRHMHTHMHAHTPANIHRSLTDCMHYLVFALVYCKANSCSSKSNLSNRLSECVAWDVCARMCVCELSSSIPNTHSSSR